MIGDKPGLRVLMTTDTVGGVFTYTLELARALRPQRVELLLLAMGGAPTRSQRQQASALSNLSMIERDYALEWMDEPWRDVDAAGRELLDLETQWKPDLIHVNGYSHAVLPFRAPVVVVAHSCVCSWWRAVKGEPAPARWNAYRRRTAHGLRRAHEVVAPTAAILDAILDEHAVKRRGRVIPNGVDANPPPARRKQPLVFCAGRLWDDAKNLAALEACATRVKWPIVVAGQTKRPDGSHVSARGLRLLGTTPPHVVRDWMRRAAVYAAPARYEPFGLSVLEAALSGCALLLGDIGTLREVWGDAALYAPPDDPDAITAQLSALIDDPALRTALAARARARASRLTAVRMATAYRALYDEVLEGHFARARPGAVA